MEEFTKSLKLLFKSLNNDIISSAAISLFVNLSVYCLLFKRDDSLFPVTHADDFATSDDQLLDPKFLSQKSRFLKNFKS